MKDDDQESPHTVHHRAMRGGVNGDQLKIVEVVVLGPCFFNESQKECFFK